MQNQNVSEFFSPGQIFEIVSKRRWYIIIPLALSLIVGIYLAFTMAKVYQAQTLILVQPQKVPDEYVQSVVSADIENRLATISQQILSRTNLEKIISRFQLFSGPDQRGMFFEDQIASLREQITVDIIRDRRQRRESTADAFAISFKGENPHKVMQIANTLASFFIEENLKVRETQAIGTSNFLDEELNTKKIHLDKLETALKDFRQKYMGELPEQLESNLSILERLQEQMSAKQTDLRETNIALSQLENRIFSPTTVQSMTSGADAPNNLSLEAADSTNLIQLKKLLSNLKMRYTDQHPDVIRLQNRIAELEENLAPDQEVSITDPYIEPKSELIRQKRILEGEIAELTVQTDLYRSRVENTPRIEQELLALERDYDNIKASYDSLLDRKLEADLAVNMEKKQKGEQFHIVDPARLPTKPLEPDLQKLLLFSLLVGIGLGCGLIFLREKLDTTIKKPEEIETQLNIPLLAVIPAIQSRRQIRFRKVNKTFGYFMTGICILLLGAFAFITYTGTDQTLELLKLYVSL